MSNSVECNFNELTYYQKNREVTLNRAKGYYENDKERFREQARDKHRKKSKKREYGKNRYHNICQKKKNKD